MGSVLWQVELERSQTPLLARTPNNPAPALGVIQGAGDVQLTNANINVAGRDSHSHTHIHYHGPAKDLMAILDAVDNFRKIQQDTLAKATPGTVKWLFVSPFFSVWWDKNGKGKILWGSGIPGAGKTILTSLVIDEIEHRAADPKANICVAYFFMRYSQHSEVTVRNVLEVLVKQTLERHEHLLQLAEQVYARHIREGTQPTETQLVALLEQFNAHMSITFYILDALDEAPIDIQHDLVETLASLNAQIFITSRPMQDVQAYFTGAHCFEIAAQDWDLDLHIAKKLQGSPRLRALLDRGEDSVKQRVISTVKLKCGGMFLHASLQLDALQRCFNIYSVMQTLERFPAKIEHVYTQTWERILNQDTEHAILAKLALLWVLYAKRSLTVRELCQAIATCPESHRYEEERLVPESTITDFCYGLLTVDKKSQHVRLVHYTAKEPLLDLLHSSFPHPHSPLAAVCVARLKDCGFQNTTFAYTWELDIALNAEPLLDYAYSAWAFHTQGSLDLHFTASQIATFIAECRAFPVVYDYHQSRVCDSLGPLHIVSFYKIPTAFAGPHDVYDVNSQTTQQKRTPLHLACIRRNYGVAQGLLCLPGILVDVRDSDGNTALELACSEACEDIVKLLLAHSGISINLAKIFKRSFGMSSCRPGDEAIVKLLLAHPSIEVNLVDHDGDTPLIAASRLGHRGIFILLLAHPDIDVNLQDKSGDTALTRASREGCDAIIRLLLAHPRIDVNLVGKGGDAALLLACLHGRGSTVKLLLTHPNIEIHQANDAGYTAFMCAAQNGHESIVKFLLCLPRIEVNRAGRDGPTAVMLASQRGYITIVKLLLAHPDIEVNLADHRGNTPLIITSQNAYQGILKVLLAHPRIEVNSVNHDGDTALVTASRRGYSGVAMVLLADIRIQVNLVNKAGETALLLAASGESNVDTVKLLLAHPDIDVNLAGDTGDSALIIASRKGYTRTARFLLSHPNINVDSVNHNGDTALMIACRKGHDAIVDLLLADPNIKVNLVNNDGDTALLLAASREINTSTIKLLLTHPDIGINLPDEGGDTALLNASREGFEDIVAVLLAHPSIMVNVVNSGETPLIAAASWDGNEGTVKLLLAHPHIEVDLSGTYGDTALMVASCKGHRRFVELLLAAPGIDVNRPNRYGDTAIKIAVEYGREDIALLLLQVPGINTSLESIQDVQSAISAGVAKGHGFDFPPPPQA